MKNVREIATTQTEVVTGQEIARVTLVTVEARGRTARIRPVRAFSSFSLFVMLACALSAPADTIHLKNGRLIYADRVRQATKNVEYDIGDNSYAIPKSVVDHVESGGAARAHSSSGQGARDSATQLPPRSEERLEGKE